ncbi:helicase-related protein [Vulcanisaeta distributa]|uniref:helicase-related protein n=1 Tax=Vulcanisaeta distributa TaxID=164451 RepID=UPI001FB3B6F0|nr:helicase-related protein [Vulcanisaeta distributa]
MAELLMYRFTMLGYDSVGIHHSSLSKVSRITTERAFKDGKLKAVIATSSLELGIDIGHVDFVIQYLSPHQVIRLVQRIGRSGHRLDKVPRGGVVITEDLNDTLEAVAIINRAKSGGLLEATQIPDKPYDVLVHQIVSLLMIKNRWTIDELYDLIRRAYPYRKLSIEELKGVLRFMSEVLNPRLAYFIEDEGVVLKPSGVRARREMYKYFFDQMSMIPDEKHYLVINQANEEPLECLMRHSSLSMGGSPALSSCLEAVFGFCRRSLVTQSTWHLLRTLLAQYHRGSVRRYPYRLRWRRMLVVLRRR